MAWMYFSVCITDFILFPILWSILQAIYGVKVIVPWNPITLQSGSMFHVAMGAILGISVWKKSDERSKFMQYTDSENERNIKKVPKQDPEEL